VTLKEGDLLSIDGSTGRVILGMVPLIPPKLSEEFQFFLSWADDCRELQVRANADTPEDAAKAREFGAQGIGLCRTEHMFMAQETAAGGPGNDPGRGGRKGEGPGPAVAHAAAGLQKIFRAMASLPVTIRLLDPPLHEFLPNLEKLVVERTLLKAAGAPEREIYEKDKLIKQVRSLTEANPMLGHRGCRLGILFPEIYQMQVDAIFYAVAELQDEGVEVTPEIMIPLVGTARELEIMRQMVEERAEAIAREKGIEFHYLVGTMIELPRACVTAGSIARYADFFSFGTNDLTQTTFGYSRDDAEGKFLHYYINNKIIPENPFAVLDREGWGTGEDGGGAGRRRKTGFKMGICGEHGGDPSSIEFCQQALAELCQLFPLPGAGGPAGRRPGILKKK
jgi:pyruvate, orthophosphate dikinase